jgi:DNA-binding Xre family transcriptional regulator
MSIPFYDVVSIVLGMGTARKRPGSPKGQPKPVKRRLDPAFSERLKDTMQAKKLDVPALAKRIGCSRAAIHRYLKGAPAYVEPHIFIDICEELGISPTWLLYGDRNRGMHRA